MKPDLIDDLKQNERYSSVDLKEYIGNTAFENQIVDVGYDKTGSLKLTPELYKQAAMAIRSRVEATKEYTKNRIDRINRNYDLQSGRLRDPDADCLSPYPETAIAVDDWVDDLYLIFSKINEYIELEDNTETIGKTIARVLDVSASEESPREGMFNEVFSKMRSVPMTREADAFLPQFIDYLKNLYDVSFREKDVYQFQVGDLIKSTLIHQMEKTGLFAIEGSEDRLNKFLRRGVVSGLFCLKEVWGTKRNYRLVQKKSKNGEAKFEREIEEEESYSLIPTDTRNLIFRKDNLEEIIEKVHTSFKVLRDKTFDANGKVLENALYDEAALMKVAEYLKKKPTTKEEIVAFDALLPNDTGLMMSDDIYALDGDVLVLEGNFIPLVINGKVYKSIITVVQLGEDILVPIGVRPTKYFEINYNFSTMFPKEGDVAGMGLPEVIEQLQLALNRLFQFGLDMAYMAVWGIICVDENCLVDPGSLLNMQPKTAVQLKNMAGRRIEDVIKWYTPPMQIMATIQGLIAEIKDTMRRVGRKGPSGEKIHPNPTATEANAILQEQEKSVNRAAIRLNSMFERIYEKMYIYNMLNAECNFKIQAQAKRINEVKLDSVDQGVYKTVDKYLDVSPTEIFVDGLKFRVKAYENIEKEGLEKQQSMQLLNLLLPLSTDPTTGTPKIYTDETGAKWVLDEYAIISTAARKNGSSDIWMKFDPSTMAPRPMTPEGAPGQGEAPGLAVPPLSAQSTPNMGALLSQAQQA